MHGRHLKSLLEFPDWQSYDLLSPFPLLTSLTVCSNSHLSARANLTVESLLAVCTVKNIIYYVGTNGNLWESSGLFTPCLFSLWCLDGTVQCFWIGCGRLLCSGPKTPEFCTTRWVMCVCFPSRWGIMKLCKCIQFLCRNSKAVTHGFFCLVPKRLKAHVQFLWLCL